ncbi:MAG: TetR/AcrR family transcriptional regulator, partial [Ilumatobacteraceae bacterium]
SSAYGSWHGDGARMTTIVESESVHRIRRSALAEIRKTGIIGLRLADVAAGADVSVPLIYKYFGDRDGLIGDVLDDVLPLVPKPDDA